MMVPGGILAALEAVNEVLSFRFHGVRRNVRHFLSFPKRLHIHHLKFSLTKYARILQLDVKVQLFVEHCLLT